ncbi:PH domain-containing protein [Janibacter sp. G368]|uniref:PH domain-containing protein n=1 Tax=Janibacter sp. G368 TaxID=3420441 RepID=UPI003D05000F
MSELDEGFVRVHPVSPFIRGGLVVLGVLGYLVSQQVDTLAAAFGGGDDDSGPGGPAGAVPGVGTLLQAGAVGLVVVGAVLLGLVSWWFTRYRLGDHSIEMRTGVLFRQHRQVRYDRIQAVDLVRPLLARLCGLSEVRVESAGGGDSHLSIAYLRVADAESVRERLLGLAQEASATPRTAAGEGGSAAGAVGGDEPGAPRPDLASSAAQAAEERLLVVPPARVVASVLLSGEAIFVALIGVVAVVLALVGLAPAVTGLFPVVVVAGGRALLRLTRWWGLVIGLRGSTLTSQRGLTDTRTSSVPLHRVQAVQVDQPWLWRRAGWWSLTVNVAGAEIGSAAESADPVLVPAATTPEVLHLLHVVTGDAGTTREVRDLMTTTPTGFVGQPRRARWVHPFAHRHIGYLAGQAALLDRSGWLDRRIRVAPWGRVQSLTVSQGPLARRLDVATVHAVSTVGPVDPGVCHLDRAHAEALRGLVEAHASPARRDDDGGPACNRAPDAVDYDG